MAETEPRRSAEIRRMASQKVAVEMIKVGFQGEVGDREFMEFFFNLVDRIDEDVVFAGDRAEASIQRVTNQAPKDSSPTTVVDTSSTTEISPDVKLNDLQQKKMREFLDEFVDEPDMAQSGRIAYEVFKLKLWTMQLPNNITHRELVKTLTVEQGMMLYGWVKETQGPDDAA